MKTSLPIATVSYNSVVFLTKVLNRLVDEKRINFWSFIEHMPEDDEKKIHLHVFLVPNGIQDTDNLREDFQEFTSVNEKPLNILPFRSSKWQEWFLYSSHNRKYLDSKMEVRKYYYSKEDFCNSDDTYFNELIHTIDYSKFMGTERFLNALRNGLDFRQCCIQGIVPIGLVGQYQRFYEVFKGSSGAVPSGVAKGETLSVPEHAENGN